MNTLSLSNALFSKVQQRVLALIFGQSERSFYTTEIVRHVASGTGAVERELARLLQSGLVTLERIGNQKHYRANKAAPIFEELRSLVIKTVWLIDPIKKSLEPYTDSIDAAFVFGSFAKGTNTMESDIDIMIIGDELDLTSIHSALLSVGAGLHRRINPLFVTRKDWQRKTADSHSVFGKIKISPKLFILGSNEALAA